MCSREPNPTSTLTPLLTAHLTLLTALTSSTAHLRILSTTLSTATTPATAEATCLEALAIAAAALARIQRYIAFYAPLFEADDPVGVLRRAGVVFVGDAGAGVGDGGGVVVQEGAVGRTIRGMVRVIGWYGEVIGGLERGFREGLGWIEEREREREEGVLAGRVLRGEDGFEDYREEDGLDE
ncbi:hypothetical protein P171DRAFT_481843 [Karstenula rhodostoma CBS 690.94]|uniref:Uncharacterized protein n=1 Tax=Karstenula rhodostoma CBS 690.94 TaxID=1392251 RepID=A0A9P4UG55_9PLEO|nr:hypothetical protein P171DRAFT_481843 [Karstenula rhodostoma CBS 690.94]